MNHDRVKQFREKLDRLNLSDYHGLSGPGLTCYLNSVLQVLFMTQDFREAVKRCCSPDPASIDTELLRLFADLQRNIARTHSITNKLGISNVYEQRDAAEYFEKILCLTSAEATQMFRGQLNHRSQCLSCREENDCRSFFWLLPLAVEHPPRRTSSVEEGLRSFFRGEKVCGDNRMFCSRCDQKQDAHFECEITQSPEVLTLLLKRFSFDVQLRRFIKLHCAVDVPQTLHIRRCRYELYALVDHFGDLTGGHYTAQIKSFETGVWYHFNDDTVNEVRHPLFGAGHEYLRSSTAYLLMYRKVSKTPRNPDEGDQESLCARSHVESGEATQESLQHVNGEIDTAGKKQINRSGEKQLKGRAGSVRTHRETLHTDSRDGLPAQKSNYAALQKDGGRHELDANLHQVDWIIEQNHASSRKRLEANEAVRESPDTVANRKSSVRDYSVNSTTAAGCKAVKKEAVTGERTGGSRAKRRGEAGVGACVCSSSSSYSCSSSYSAAAPFRMHEPSGCSVSPVLSRKSKSLQSDREAAGSGCKLDTKTVTRGSKTMSDGEAKSRDRVRKEPWR